MVASRRRLSAVFAFVFAAVFFPTLASAATGDFRVLIDSDNNPSTGCTESGMSGVEQIFVTRVVTTGTTAQVTRTYRQVCASGSFGAPLDLDLTPRPAGYNSPSGLLLAESRLAFTSIIPGATMLPTLRLGFDLTDGISTQRVLTRPNGTAILYPTINNRRHSVSASGARTFVLDGLGNDWNNISPLVQGVATAGSVATRILKAYAYANPGDDFLYFRFDGFLDNNGPFAQDDFYARKPGEGLNVAAPGVLANDGDGQGKPLTAQPVSPAEHGSVVLNPDGSFTYAPDNPAALSSDKFDYKANNGTKDSNVARVTISVSSNPSQPVIANDDSYTTPEDTQLNVGAPGVLGNDVDPDGQGLSATLLTNPSHGNVILALNGAFTYTPAANFNGIDTFKYRVSDGTSNDDATVTITISSVNDAPKANNVSRTTNEEQSVSVTLSGSDPEGSTLTYNVSPPANGVLSGVAPNLTYTPALNFYGIDTFTYTVSDGSKVSAPATVTITVNPVNDVPSFTAGPSPVTRSANAGPYSQPWATSISPGPNEAGQLVNFIVSNNNNALFSVQPAISPTGVLTFTPAGNVLGSATVSVQIHDNGGTANGGVDTSTPPVTFTITITCPVITVTNPATTTGSTGTPFSATFTQSGGIGAVTFTTASTLPAGLSLATNGTLSGSPTQTGTFPITVTATDSQGCTGTGPTYTLIISCGTITVINPGTNTGTVGTAFSQTFTQSGAVGGATFTTSSTLPSGLSLATNGTLSGTPTQFGTFPIVVTVTDGTGCTANGPTYNLTVSCQTISVSNPGTNSGTAGTAFSQTFTQSGALGGATFTTVSTLPAGLALATNGVLSGTPTQTGSFPIVVTVTDGNGCTGTGSTYTLTIGCQTITVTNPVTNTGTAGSAFSQTFTQSGAIGGATFTTASTLPAGLTLAANGVLSGTPTVVGSFPIVVTVTDGNGCTGTGSTYNLTIGCQSITVTNPSNATGTANAAFSEQFTQSGAIGGATFTTASTLPTGLTLSTSGLLSGTPTQTGPFPIVVTVTDGNGCTGTSATYNLTINCQTITVTKPVNTAGTVNAPFSETFTQSGAIGGATFTTASTLPAGLTLATNGVLSGTPTQPGPFPIVVTVTDGNGCTGTSATYNLVIACQTITVTNPVTTSSPAGTPLSINFTQTGAIGTATFTTSSTLPTGLSLAANGTLSGTPMQGGSFPIAVTVTDSNGCTGVNPSYTLTITCPTITVTNPVNNLGTSGVAFSETFSQSGGVGTITWSVSSGTLPSGITLNTSSGVLSGTTNAAGVFPITVTATDQNGCQGTGATYNLTINCQTITASNPGVNTGTVDAAFSQTFTQTGILGTATWSVQSGSLPAGLLLNSGTGVLSGTPTVNGVFNLTIRVTDTNGCFDDTAYTLTINCQTITVTNPGVNTGTVDAPFSQTFTQSGAHGTATFTTSSTLPAGLTLSAAGVLSGTPTVNGNFPIVVTVTDDNSCTGTSATYNLTINCQTITVTNPGTNSGTVGTFFSQTFTQSGAHGTASFATASTLPAGLTLATNGTLSGTPSQFGTFPIVVTVTDSNGCTGTGATYNLTISCQTITVTNPVNTNGTVNAAFSETFTQTGALGGATFSTASTLPTGLSLSSAGVLSGTPTQAGSFPIVVTVTDGNGCTGTGSTYTLVIACQAISVTNPGNNIGTAGSAFSELFTQTGGVGTITWSLDSGSLPTGIILNSSTGQLSGTTSQVGTFPITVKATDQNGCFGVGATYNLTFNCQTISITNPTLNSVQAGSSLTPASSWTFSATGILGTANWTVDSGSLPTGITLNSGTGVLSGSSTQQGTFPVVIKVTDTNGCFATSNYTLTVTCPTITPARTGGGSFPQGTINSVYAGQSFTATGGTGPYTFAVTSGTFPPGLTLASGGGISGTPTATGTFNFTVTATDTATTCTGSASFSIAVKPAAGGDSYSNLVNNTEAVVTGGTTTSPATPFVPLTGTIIANDAPSGSVAVTTGTFATTQGGSVTIAADGTFKYTPPVTASALASDTFTYTITSDSGGTGTPTANTGTVTLNLSNRVWYVKNNAVAGGNGQSQSPFNSLANFTNGARATPDKTGDIIYVYNGDGTTTNYNAGVVLLNTEQLIGEGVALVVNSVTLVPAGTKPQITNTAGTSVTLGDGNTVKGLTITGASTDGIAGSGKAGFTGDTLTIQNNTGSGIHFTSMTGTLTIGNFTVTNNGTGVNIDNGTATIQFNGTSSITANAGQRSLSIQNRPGSAGNITFNAPITDSGTGILINANTSGSVTFNGTLTLTTTTNTALNMTSNTGFASTFNSTINITTTTGTGINGTGGGSVAFLGTTNVTTGAATAGINLNGLTVAGSTVFNSVNTTGATTGVSLVNLSAVNPIAINGGTISNGTTGISLQGTGFNVSLANLTITGPTTGITNTTNFGTLTIGASVSVSAVTALNLTTGTVSGTFASVSSTGGTNGVNLTSVSGTWGTTAGSLTGATGSTFNVSGGGSGTISWGATINQANGANVVTIAGGNSNTINFSGNVTTSGTSTGISISASSGTYNFTGATSTIAGSGGGIVIFNESGNVSFGSGYSITAATTSFKIGGTATATTANITYSGTLSNTINGGVLIDVNSAAGSYSGNLTMNGSSLSGVVAGANGVISVFKNVTGTIAISNLNLQANANTFANTLVAISGANAGSNWTFNHMTLQANGNNHTGKGLVMSGGGQLTITASGGNSSIDVGSSALDLNGITLNASTIATLNSLGVAGANGAIFTNVTGSGLLTITAGAITGNNVAAFAVSGGNPQVSFGGSVTQNVAARAVDIQGATGGSISINSVTCGNAALGVHIGDTSASNGNVTFTTLTLGTSGSRMTNQAVTITNGSSAATIGLGTVSIFTTGVSGIVATNLDGTLNSTAGTVDSSTATAISIDGPAGKTTLGMTLTRVDSAGGTADGISIVDTDGSFTVNGDGSNTTLGGNGSGGTISGKSGADSNDAQGIGVFMNNASNITLRRMTINGTNQNFGVRGNSVSGFTMEYSTVSGTNGTSAALDEGSVNFDNLSGAAAITSCVIDGGFEDNINVVNTSGTLNRLVISACTLGFNNTTNGNNNITLESQSTSDLRYTIQNCLVKGARADWVNAQPASGGTMDGIISNNTFDNLAPNNHPGPAANGNRLLMQANGTYTLQINNNIIKGSLGAAIATNSLTNSASMAIKILSNTIGVAATANSGSTGAGGISVQSTNGGDVTATIDSNTVKQYNNHGILLTFGDLAGGTATINVTVSNNTVNTPGNLLTNFNGFHLNNGTVATDNHSACVNIFNNNFTGGGSGAVSPNNDDVRLRQRQNTTVNLPGYTGPARDNGDNVVDEVILYLRPAGSGGVKNNTFGVGTANSVSTGGGFVNTSGGAACPTP